MSSLRNVTWSPPLERLRMQECKAQAMPDSWERQPQLPDTQLFTSCGRRASHTPRVLARPRLWMGMDTPTRLIAQPVDIPGARLVPASCCTRPFHAEIRRLVLKRA